MIRIDTPQPARISSPYDFIVGWIELPSATAQLSANAYGFPLTLSQYPRPDLPSELVKGFTVFIDLITLYEHGLLDRTNKLSVQLRCDDYDFSSIDLPIDLGVLSSLGAMAVDRKTKQAILPSLFSRIPNKRSGCRSPDFLPETWNLDPRISQKSDSISAHGYGPLVNELLAPLDEGSLILDVGAGFRRWPRKNVVHLEIYDYPSTDVLAVGEDLPFPDNTFDSVLSLAVLEHVQNPFICAAELTRVVKPGGKICAVVPFLQAEHGYPSHYFNCTRFGLRQLFSNCELVSHQLDIANHPINTLAEILYVYACGLPESIRCSFLDMPVRSFIENHPHSRQVQSSDYVRNLAPESAWKIASGTSAVFRKPL